MKQIGTIKLKIDRVFPAEDGSEVCVAPDVYPVFENLDLVFWTMEGYVNNPTKGELRSLGDGMFLVSPGFDSPILERKKVDSKPMTLNKLLNWSKERDFTDRYELNLYC